MKKGFKITFLVLTLISLGYYGYTRYHNTQSLKGVVHSDAERVIKVSIHALKESLAVDILSAPHYYYNIINLKSSSEEDEKESSGNGITLMPNNILLFKMPQIDNTLFTVLKIYDAPEFNTFIRKELKEKSYTIKKDATGAYQTSLFKNKNTVIAWNADKLVVALSSKINSSSVATVFNDILIEDKTVSDTDDHSLLKKVKNQNSHVTYADANGVSTLDFEDGQAVLKGNTINSKPFKTTVMAPKYRNASLSFHYNTPLDKSKKQQLKQQLKDISFFKKHHLNIEKILEPLNGNFDFSIAGKVIQNDTIITYGYNDNFEKVEQKSVEEKEVPAIHLGLGLNNESLYTYFSDASVLSKHDIFEPFPLYQLKVEESFSQINFNTNHSAETITKEESAYFLTLITDFTKLQEDIDIPQTKKLFSLLNKMEIQAWYTDENKIQLKGFITGFNSDVNIVSQVFFGLKEQNKESQETTKL